jgi:iron complex outermembrane receptor protein
VSDQRTSQHKVNAGVQLRTKPGIDGSIDFHWVSEQIWAEQVTNLVRQQIERERLLLAGYALLNARLGYRFPGNQADVSVVGFNVLGLEHREHPFGQLVNLRVMGLLSYRF